MSIHLRFKRAALIALVALVATITVPLLATFAEGQSPSAASLSPSSMPQQLVQLQQGGEVKVDAAKIIEVSPRDMFVAQTDINSYTINWTVKLGERTTLKNHEGNAFALDDFAVGQMVSFTGMIDASAPGEQQPMVLASMVQNWTRVPELAPAPDATFGLFGVVTAINEVVPRSIMVATPTMGTILVKLFASTDLHHNGDHGTTFEDVRVGQFVHVHGSWGSWQSGDQDVVNAQRIRIFTEPNVSSSVFEGRIISAPTVGSGFPSSMVVRVGDEDQTVLVDLDTMVLSKSWAPTHLTDFTVGERVRMYGFIDHTIIDARVVRNLNT